MKHRICLVVILAMLVSALPSNAQFFKKLKENVKKKTEKLDKSLEKPAEGVVKGAVGVGKYVFTDDEQSDAKNNGKKSETSKSSSDAYDEAKTRQDEARKQKEEDLTKKEPFIITDQTIFINGDDPSVVATSVHEGVFGVNDDGRYTFYKMNGSKLVDGEWAVDDSYRTPIMTPQGMIMFKAGETYKKPMYLIKSDGSVKALPLKYVRATNFVDGLAIVSVKDLGKAKWQFINANCEVVYPNIHPEPARIDGVNATIAPLRNNRRAYYTKDPNGYGSVWGFIDGSGKVVIEPQFAEVRSFNEGFALVRDKKGKVYFINVDGKKAFEPQWREDLSMVNISDFDSGIFKAPGEKIGAYRVSNYYNATGNLVGKALLGTAFHKGIAYFLKQDKETGKYYTYRLMTGMGEGDRTSINFIETSVPIYDELDFAHISPRIILGGPGNDKYIFDYSISGFSADGYAKASMQANTGNKYYKGFIDRAGNYVLIYSINDTSVE